MPPMLRQCATTAITAGYAASIMFTMAAMLDRLVAQLKMPRLDAYPGYIDLTPTNRPALPLRASAVGAFASCLAWSPSHPTWPGFT